MAGPVFSVIFHGLCRWTRHCTTRTGQAESSHRVFVTTDKLLSWCSYIWIIYPNLVNNVLECTQMNSCFQILSLLVVFTSNRYYKLLWWCFFCITIQGRNLQIIHTTVLVCIASSSSNVCCLFFMPETFLVALKVWKHFPKNKSGCIKSTVHNCCRKVVCRVLLSRTTLVFGVRLI